MEKFIGTPPEWETDETGRSIGLTDLDGSVVRIAAWATDNSGNPTGLTGPDGATIQVGEGNNVVTVGNTGRYQTIAEAVAYINTQTIFTAVLTTTCDLTANDLYELTLTDALPYDSTTKNKELFIKLGTNPFYYPINFSGNSAITTVRVKYPIYGLATGVQAAVVYAATRWTIKLLAGSHAISDGTEVTLPPCVDVVGAGIGVSVVSGRAGSNIGVMNAPVSNGRNSLRNLTISTCAGDGEGSCFSVENVNATSCTTGYSLVCKDVEFIPNGVAIDGLHIKATNTNVTDYVEVIGCKGFGIYDTVALLSTRRASVRGCNLRSTQNPVLTSTLPVGINISGAKVYPSFFEIHDNVFESVNTATSVGAAAMALQISANTLDTASYVVANITGNRFVAKTTAATIYSSTYGIATQQSAGSPAHVVMSRNNVFDCSGSPTASVDIYSNEGTILSAGDRKITGLAVNTNANAPGVVTVEL